ncbi:MAG: hypothetical protein KC445_11190 [Anaerolineales bacterium]|nr:hypothetical protein [Anaerolineales bacterium]
MKFEAIPVKTELTATQLAQLETLAKQTRTTVAELIQAAVLQTYFTRPTPQQALSQLLALDVSVADWPQMEAEVERAVLE